MELAVPISILLGYVGYQFNKNGKVTRNDDNIRNSISKNNTPTGNNVYNSISSKEYVQEQQTLANKRYDLSKNPINTNIIPASFNSSYQTPVINSILPSVTKNVDMSKNDQNLNNMINSPMFKPVPFKTLGASLTGPMESSGYAPILTENFGNISQLTGQLLDTNHVNMVPHFGSHVKQNIEPDKNQSILERYTGISGNEIRIKKKEIANMYDSVQENIFGHHFVPDLSRIVQSSYKTSQSPIEKIQVSPIPGASNRSQYRTNTQRNVNPRQTNRTPDSIAGINQSQTTRGILGHVSKNRPDTTWETGPDRLLVGSTLSAPTMRENFRNGCSNITEATYNVLPAGSLVQAPKTRLVKNNSSNPLDTIVRDDFRNTGHTDGFRNASGFQKELSDITRNSYTARENERDTTSRMTILPPSDTKQGEYHAYTDIAKITTKQTNLFSYTGGASSANSKPTDNYAEQNPTRVTARLTLKDYIGNAGNTQQGYIDNNKYENMEIRSNKDTISDTMNYTHDIENGSKISSGKYSVNMRLRDIVQETPNKGFNFTNHSIIPEISDYTNIGDSHVNSNRTINENDLTSRIDQVYVDQLNDNPYSINILN